MVTSRLKTDSPGPEVSRRQARRTKRTEQYLAIARELFLERGYDATRVEEVSDRAGYSKRTLYLYFDTKHELFCAVLCPILEALQESLLKAASHGQTGRDQLIDIARAYFDFAQTQLDAFSLLLYFETHDFYRSRNDSSVPKHAAQCMAVNEQISEHVDSIIQRGINDGSIASQHTPAQLNLMFWASSVGLMQVCRQRAGVLEDHYGITESDLLDGFVQRFFPVLHQRAPK